MPCFSCIDPPRPSPPVNGNKFGNRSRSPSPPGGRGIHTATAVPYHPAASPRRSLFGEAAAIAGGVTAGTAMGHVAGSAITSLFSGPRRQEMMTALPRDYQPGTEPAGPCALEIQHFLQCASNSPSDLTACQQFNDILQECKRRNGIP